MLISVLCSDFQAKTLCSRAAKRGVSNGGVSRSGLVPPLLFFLGLSAFFRDFLDVLGDSSGIFPIRPFLFQRIAQGAGGKGLRQKIVKKGQKVFRHFSTIFARHQFSGPFWGALTLSRPIKSTYEEQSRKGPRHNLDLSRKKWETPPVWKPPGLASLNLRKKQQ